MFQRPETYVTSTLIALAARMNVFQCAVSSFFSMRFKFVPTNYSKDESDEESNVDDERY